MKISKIITCTLLVSWCLRNMAQADPFMAATILWFVIKYYRLTWNPLNHAV